LKYQSSDGNTPSPPEEQLSPAVLSYHVAMKAKLFAEKLLGPDFKAIGYEILPTSKTRNNFIVTMRHINTHTELDTSLDMVLSFVVTDKEAVLIASESFEAIFALNKLKAYLRDKKERQTK
jgi:hypothetical protein